jgi:hypothetical protein
MNAGELLLCHRQRTNLRTASPSSRRFLLLASRTRAFRFCEEPKIGSGCTLTIDKANNTKISNGNLKQGHGDQLKDS